MGYEGYRRSIDIPTVLENDRYFRNNYRDFFISYVQEYCGGDSSMLLKHIKSLQQAFSHEKILLRKNLKKYNYKIPQTQRKQEYDNLFKTLYLSYIGASFEYIGLFKSLCAKHKKLFATNDQIDTNFTISQQDTKTINQIMDTRYGEVCRKKFVQLCIADYVHNGVHPDMMDDILKRLSDRLYQQGTQKIRTEEDIEMWKRYYMSIATFVSSKAPHQRPTITDH